MIEPAGYVVRIERTFDAPAEAVFHAWTSPEVMRRWFHCAPCRCSLFDVGAPYE